MIKTSKISLCAVGLILCFAGTNINVYAQSTQSNQHSVRIDATETITAKDVRALCFSRDFEGAYFAGKLASAQASNPDPQLQAWYLMAMSAAGRQDDAVAAAEQMLNSLKDPAWGLFALTGALMFHGERYDESLAVSEKALASRPDEADFIWLRAEVLERHANSAQAITFIDSQIKNVKNPAELLVVRANTLMNDYNRNRDEKSLNEALSNYEQARRHDANNVNALYYSGYYTFHLKDYNQGLPLLKQALALSPYAKSLRSEYWRAVMSRSDLLIEQKRTEVIADIEKFLAARGDYPNALYEISRQYHALNLKEKAKEIETKILSKHYDSPAAEWVLEDQARALEQLGQQSADPQQNGAAIKLYWQIIRRPKHYYSSKLGIAYRHLFDLIRSDKSISTEQLMEVINGMIKYDTSNAHLTYPSAIRELADRKSFRAAEQIARDGLTYAMQFYERFKRKGNEEFAKQSLTFLSSMMISSLGYVYQQEGRLDDAEKELLKLIKGNSGDAEIAFQLGQIYEAKKELSRAEEFYIRGAIIVANQPGNNNPCDKALKALYIKRNGSEAGYTEYLAKLKQSTGESRRAALLETLNQSPEPIQPFNLKNLKNEIVSLDKLKGRVVLINFWATWCGPCVAEMPELQKLSDKYSNDKEVVILTINMDADISVLRAYMELSKFTFTNLIDEGYSDKVKVSAIPTTWILDKQGRQVFATLGSNANLLEEFSWIIEELKQRK